MKSPGQMTLGERVMMTIVICLVILAAFAFAGWITGGWSEAPAQQRLLYEGVPLDAHLLPKDKEALAAAYHDHLIHLWTVWLRDGAGDASRISNGLRIARRAYHQAAEQISRREKELQQQEQQQK